MMKTPFLQAVNERIFVGEGAMATYLYQLGVSTGICYEELSVTQPDLIRQVHEEYKVAGATLAQTNTYSANRENLSQYGLERHVKEFIQASAQIARDVVGSDGYVAGTIGSVLGGKIPTTKLSFLKPIYEEVVDAFLTTDIDAFLLETYVDVEELLLVIETIRAVSDLPIIAQLALLEPHRTRDGYDLTTAFQLAVDKGANIVGLNCRLGPAELVRSLEKCHVPEGVALSIYPNAGRLAVNDGKYSFAAQPHYFGQMALSFRDQGATIIGGCCGTTPDHIRLMRQMLGSEPPIARRNPAEPYVATPIVREVASKKATIVDKVKSERVIIVELDPPKDLSTDKFFAGVQALKQADVDAVTMADNSLASTRMSNLALAAIMKMQYHVEPLVHIACRDRNLIGQQSLLMGLHALDAHQVLVITGDPARFGDLPGATSVFDVTSFELIKMIKQLNSGLTFAGKALNEPAQFTVGTAFNPHVKHMSAAVKRLEKKIASGADYVMTQPVYDKATIRAIYEATKHLDIPIFIGIMPLTGSKNAEFLHNEVPGIKIEDSVREQLRPHPHGEEARQIGLTIAKELIDEALNYFNGIYLITPFFYYEMTAELAKYIRQHEAPQLV